MGLFYNGLDPTRGTDICDADQSTFNIKCLTLTVSKIYIATQYTFLLYVFF